jgi:hypothetical protein
MKKFADGGKAQGRYDRKTADIKSDYEKALKAGRNADVAKAKMEQRMADAKDDMAKWTKSDRTETKAAEKAAEGALSIARRTKGANIANRDRPSTMADRPEYKPPSVDVPKVAPKLEAERKKAPVRRPVRSSATTPRGRVTVSEGSSSPAPVSAPANRQQANAYRNAFQSGRATAAQETARLRATAGNAPRRATTDEVIATDIAGRTRNLTPEQRRKLDEAVARSGERSSFRFAKGGSVDGCAVRGKTRAMRKK